MQKNKLLFLVLVVTISGCSLFSHPYTKPTLDIPSKWNHSNSNSNMNSSIKAESLAEMAWWQQFGDPHLNKIIESAVNNNNDVKMAIANLANAQGQLKQVQLSWIPNIPLLLGFSQMPVLNNPGYFVGLFPSYTLNIFSQIKATEQAKHQLEVTKYIVNGARLTVIGQAAGSYFTLASQLQQLHLTKKLLKMYQQREQAYRKQFELGLTDAKTVVNASSDAMQIKAQIALIENNIGSFAFCVGSIKITA